jgi:hypothetical protein
MGLTKLDGESFDKVHEGYSAGRQELKTDGKTTNIYDLYLHEQETVRRNSKYHIRDVKRWVEKFVQDFPGRIVPMSSRTDQRLAGKAREKSTEQK